MWHSENILNYEALQVLDLVAAPIEGLRRLLQEHNLEPTRPPAYSTATNDAVSGWERGPRFHPLTASLVAVL